MEDKLIVAAAAAMLMAGCATAPRAPVEPHPDTPAYSWKPLFADDLSDAEFEKGSWKLEGGVLRSLLDKPIWTKADYEDYVLDFEYMMEKDGNSGVFIYLSNLDQFPKYKIEVQLLDDESPKFKGKELAYQQSGSLYGRAAALEIASKHAGEWNRMTVFCRGKSVHVVLNGKAVVDANLDDWRIRWSIPTERTCRHGTADSPRSRRSRRADASASRAFTAMRACRSGIFASPRSAEPWHVLR